MVKQDQRVLEWKEITMLLITQQNCYILLGIQVRTQLLARLGIACICTMLKTILSKKEAKKAHFLALNSVFLGSLWWLMEISVYIIIIIIVVTHIWPGLWSHRLCNHHHGLLGKWHGEGEQWKNPIILSF